MNITGLNHITFAVADLKRAIKFYQELLGCQLAAEWDTGAYLTAGELWLCLSLDNKAKDESNPEYTHIAFSVNPAEFAIFKQLILDNNIPEWKQNNSEGDSLYILDPDHNKLELHVGDLQSRLQAMQISPYQNMKIYSVSE